MRIGVAIASLVALLVAAAVPPVVAQQPVNPMAVMAEGIASALERLAAAEKGQAVLRRQQNADRFRTGAAISRIAGVNDPDGFARSYAAKPREHGAALLTAASEIRKRLDALDAARAGAVASAPAPAAAPASPPAPPAPAAAPPAPAPAPPVTTDRDRQVAAMLEQASGVLAGAARLMRQ